MTPLRREVHDVRRFMVWRYALASLAVSALVIWIAMAPVNPSRLDYSIREYRFEARP